MADFDGLITPPASWADVPDLAVTAVARGGPTGAMNAQALALTARTEALRGFLLCRPSGGDDTAMVQMQNALANTLNMDLVFTRGQFNFSTNASFIIDISKTRWRGSGPTNLRWSDAPSGGFAINIVGSELAPYLTARKMVCSAISHMSLSGAQEASMNFPSTLIRHGDGSHQTFGYSLDHVTLSGFAVVEQYMDNVWWVSHYKCRIMWGAITTPSVNPGNWGENITYDDCMLLDGVTMDITRGDWTLKGGSCDNTYITTRNNASFVWTGAHMENPGLTTLPRYILQAMDESTLSMPDSRLIVNFNPGTNITQAPFYCEDGNPNGLHLPRLQHTQGGEFSWYTMVEGLGRVRIPDPQRLAVDNGQVQVYAENTTGKLRNYNFEAGDLSGWNGLANGTGTSTLSSARKRRGNASALLTASGPSGYADYTFKQKVAIRSDEFLAIKFSYSRDFTGSSSGGVLTGQIVWLDVSGGQISTSTLGYSPAPNTTNDLLNFYPSVFGDYAPGGAASAEIQIVAQRPSGTGSVLIWIDDVICNVL